MLEKLPLKYNTLIGQDGGDSAEGKQRILIARAVYKNRSYIFLDEATNSLHVNNERMIVESLTDFYRERAVIVVAHRLSTVKNADQIIVIEKGKIIETGSHDELIKLRGLFPASKKLAGVGQLRGRNYFNLYLISKSKKWKI